MHPAAQADPAPPLAWLLAIAGAIPFIAAAAGMFVLPPDQHPRIIYAVSTYATTILSFLGGIQWGVGVVTHGAAPRSARTLFAISVVVSLAGWALLFVESAASRLALFAACFAAVWAIDALLRIQRLIPAWFFRLRSVISIVVIATLLLVALKA